MSPTDLLAESPILTMSERIERFDWSSTPIGPRDTWPQSLRTSASICLASRFPILLWWGPELVKIYNDAYVSILGDKHPAALGSPGRLVWPEIWHIIGPMLDGVLREGNAVWADDQLLMLQRHGYPEECYFRFSYSPIVDESGGVGGIFCAVTDTTSGIVGRRRLQALEQLAARASEAKSAEEACTTAAAILDGDPRDVPFAAFYLTDPSSTMARRIATCGEIEDDLLPASMNLTGPDGDVMETLRESLAREQVVVVPLRAPGESEAAGFFIAGVSPNRALNDEYRSFFGFVGGHVSSAIANARAFELERRRSESLAALDRAKTQFFSNISHEFRTPLTLMLGPLEELLRNTEAEEQRRQLEMVNRNALRLLKLVNTLLDFSRIEAGRITASYQETDVGSLTRDLAAISAAP